MSRRTVRVRIAVAVTPNGSWEAAGSRGWPDDDASHEARVCSDDPAHARVTYVEADVPLPEPETVEGEVKP